MSALDRPLIVTTFADASASVARKETTPLRALVERLQATTATAKADLPWLKLAAFGDARTAKGSLRHDANVCEINGIEADYDGGQLSVDHARERLEQQGIAAIIYTSPSHTDDAPRWRVLCPTSRPLPGADRARLVARVNGALGGVLAPESFTSSQAYFFGSVRGNPSHRVVAVDGRAIDEAAELDAGAVWKPGGRSSRLAPRETPRAPADLAPPFAAEVVGLLNRMPNPLSADRELYLGVMMAARGCIQGLEATGRAEDGDAEAIGEAAIAWAERWEGYAGADERAKWDDDFSLRDAPLAGWHNLQRHAERLIPGYRLEQAQDEFAAVPTPPEPEKPAENAGAGDKPRLRLLTPEDCAASPPRGYLVKGLIAPRDLMIVFGQPGTGKSVICPHIGYAIAQGRRVFGRRVKEGTVFYAPAEDPHGMRQRVAALRLQHGDAPGFQVIEGISDLFGAGSDEPAALRALVAEHKPALVVLDTLAAACPGLRENESEDMSRVIALARSLTRLGAAVILVHHAPKGDDSTPRGHGILNGAADVALRLAPDSETGMIWGKLSKNRNGPSDLCLGFGIRSVEIGRDEDGDAITAPAAMELSGQDTPKEKLPRTEAAALRVLTEMIEREGHVLPGGRVAINEDDWRQECDDRRVSTSDVPKNRRDVLQRALSKLQDRGRIAFGGGYVWIPATDDGPEFPALEPVGAATAAIGAIIARRSRQSQQAKRGSGSDDSDGCLRPVASRAPAMPENSGCNSGMHATGASGEKDGCWVPVGPGVVLTAGRPARLNQASGATEVWRTFAELLS